MNIQTKLEGGKEDEKKAEREGRMEGGRDGCSDLGMEE